MEPKLDNFINKLADFSHGDSGETTLLGKVNLKKHDLSQYFQLILPLPCYGHILAGSFEKPETQLKKLSHWLLIYIFMCGVITICIQRILLILRHNSIWLAP